MPCTILIYTPLSASTLNNIMKIKINASFYLAIYHLIFCIIDVMKLFVLCFISPIILWHMKSADVFPVKNRKSQIRKIWILAFIVQNNKCVIKTTSLMGWIFFYIKNLISLLTYNIFIEMFLQPDNVLNAKWIDMQHLYHTNICD